MVTVNVLIIFLLAGCYTTEKGERTERTFLDVSGKWKFSIGDDTSWGSPLYNDFNWEEIQAPSTWENQRFHGYNGFA